MKKLTAGFLAVCMAASLLTGCGAPEPEDEETTVKTGSMEAGSRDTAKAGDGEAADQETENSGMDETVSPQDFKVGLMIPGNLGDKSFFDASFRSIEPIKEQLGVDVDYVEAGVDTSKYYPALVDMCEKGYDLILTISSNNDDALVQVAEEYPDQKFINLDDEMTEPPANVYIMGTKNNEMSFLAGAAGALKAAELGEDKIGFVGGMDIPGINEFLVGYIEGAQAVNPDIKVATSYVGSFTDTAKGKENALLLYNSGLSVIFAAAGQSGLGVIDAAVSQGKFVIGVDSDQAEALKDSKPEMANVVITSAIKNIPENAVKAVDRAMKGEIPYGTREVFGIAEDAVGIAENEFYEKLLNEKDRKQVEELKMKVVAGEVEMTPTTGITTDKVNEIREAVRP